MTTLTSLHDVPGAETVRALADAVPGNRFGAWFYEKALARGEKAGMEDRRRALVSAATGHVLEIGAGTGLNFPHYARDLERLVLAEPDEHMHRRLAQRVADAADVVRAPGEALPFADGSFDTVVSTMVLCTVRDVAATLTEVRRVLRPDGSLLFMEHVLADEPRLARRQQRWHKPWEIYGAGCRCHQPTLSLLAEHGFRVGATQQAEWDGMPSLVRPLMIGRAVPAQP